MVSCYNEIIKTLHLITSKKIYKDIKKITAKYKQDGKNSGHVYMKYQ